MMFKTKLLMMYIAAGFAMVSLFACGGPLDSGRLQDGLENPTGQITGDHLDVVFHRFWRQVEHPFLNGGIITIPAPTAETKGITSPVPSVFASALHKFMPKTTPSQSGKPGAWQLLTLPASCLPKGMFEKEGTVEIDLACATSDKRNTHGKMLVDAQGFNPLHIKADAIVDGHLNVTFVQACLGDLCIDGQIAVALKKRADNTEYLATYRLTKSYHFAYLNNYVRLHNKDRVQSKVEEEVSLRGGIRVKLNQKGEKSVELLTQLKDEDGSLALKIQQDAQNNTKATLQGRATSLECTLHKGGQGVTCKAPGSKFDEDLRWFNHFGEKETNRVCFFYCN